PYQGLALLLEAAARVERAQFLFMGGERSEVEGLRARALWTGAGERCVFAGKRPPGELPLFLSLADVVVSPRSRGENTPFKVYTYMASGRPLVATRIPTHTQLLDDTTALLVEPTPEGLARGIADTLANPVAARRRAAAARAVIDREYSPARYAEKVKTAYTAIAQA